MIFIYYCLSTKLPLNYVECGLGSLTVSSVGYEDTKKTDALLQASLSLNEIL